MKQYSKFYNIGIKLYVIPKILSQLTVTDTIQSTF